ncbi:pirin family protein [uncultured Arcticibacterium sp.]|uniref:pirin family protein n=1 Tax=uncultured Arcticibacterium sp. TaxID=2173042 RepID=UPI0030F9A037
MNSIYHASDSRGHANHGWLNSYHSFSFAGYNNPERMHFGALRVLNDDHVAGGMGFSKHPHSNMEIVSIPLEGELEHQDSIGNKAVIKTGEVQIMSAGTGVEHSEKNNNSKLPVKFLQIWVFPKEQNIKPNYDQQEFPLEERLNRFQKVVSPSSSSDLGVKINQDAWFSMADIELGKNIPYTLNKKGNGTYFFVLEGKLEIDKQKLSKRDGFGIWEFDTVDVKASVDSKVLAIEVPMTF